MTIMVRLEFPLVAHKAGEMIDILKVTLVDTRKYDGCKGVEVFLQEGGQSLILIQHWESKSKQEVYLKWRIDTGLVELIQPFLISPLVVQYYEAIDC